MLVEVLDLVEKVSDAVLHTMIPGQSPLIMKSEGLAIGLSKQTPSNLAGFSVDVGGEGQFVLPNDGSLVNRTKNSSFISATVSLLNQTVHGITTVV